MEFRAKRVYIEVNNKLSIINNKTDFGYLRLSFSVAEIRL